MSKINLDKFIGIPFSYCGKDISGCNCWELLRMVFAEYGIIVPEFIIDQFDPKTIHDSVQKGKSLWIKIEEPVEPCALLFKGFRVDAPNLATHLGIYVGEGRFLHITESRRSVNERLFKPFFMSNLVGMYEFKG